MIVLWRARTNTNEARWLPVECLLNQTIPSLSNQCTKFSSFSTTKSYFILNGGYKRYRFQKVAATKDSGSKRYHFYVKKRYRHKKISPGKHLLQKTAATKYNFFLLKKDIAKKGIRVKTFKTFLITSIKDCRYT